MIEALSMSVVARGEYALRNYVSVALHCANASALELGNLSHFITTQTWRTCVGSWCLTGRLMSTAAHRMQLQLTYLRRSLSGVLVVFIEEAREEADRRAPPCIVLQNHTSHSTYPCSHRSRVCVRTHAWPLSKKERAGTLMAKVIH